MDTPTPAPPLQSVGSQKASATRPRVAQAKLQLVIPARECGDANLPRSVRVFVPSAEPPYRPKWSGLWVSESFARQLLGQSLAVLMRTGKRVRGIRLVFPEGECVERVNIRGSSYDKPKRWGNTWIQPHLPSWLFREEFYQVLNSSRTRPFQSWDEIRVARRVALKPSRSTKPREMPKDVCSRETPAQKRVA